ncbi:MAG: hypothetical protein ACHRHE_20735 [Tepidisphaerales bacterium]
MASRYTPKDLDRLIARLRERQYAMGFHHLVYLASLTPEGVVGRHARRNLEKRQEMEDRCIERRMSNRDLMRAVQGEAGKRRQGGRPVELPFEMVSAVNRLHAAAESFVRLCKAVARPDERTLAAVEGLSPETRRRVLDEKAAGDKGGSFLSHMKDKRRKLVIQARDWMEQWARKMAKG